VLEPLMRTSRSTRHVGFTVVELLVALTIIVILLAVGVPSFNTYLARKQLEGTFNELQTDMQFARSEAVARNRLVRLTFGTHCYVIHTQPLPGTGASTSSCTQLAPSSIGVDDVPLKTVQLPAGASALLSPNDSLTWLQFEPLRGGATHNGTGAAASINVNSSVGSWQLRTDVTAAGRVHGCSPGGSYKGYPTC
jgi:type IV fimbrial biogenesis protein FimT